MVGEADSPAAGGSFEVCIVDGTARWLLGWAVASQDRKGLEPFEYYLQLNEIELRYNILR